MEDRDTELNDMTEVMQHAARKVAVMQQVVDAAKRRLQDEMECSRCLKVPPCHYNTVKTFLPRMLNMLGNNCVLYAG